MPLNGTRRDLMHLARDELSLLEVTWRRCPPPCKAAPWPVGTRGAVPMVMRRDVPMQSVAIVRNPYSRVVSAYRHVMHLTLRGGASRPRQSELLSSLGLRRRSASLHDVLRALQRRLRSGALRWVGGGASLGLTPFRPATLYTHPSGGAS